MIRLTLIFFLSISLQSEDINSITLQLNHHGQIKNIEDKRDQAIGFFQEEIKEIPNFDSNLLLNQFNRVSKIIPEGTILILSANNQGIITGMKQSKRNPSLSLSHTDIEGHSHPESLPLSDIAIEVPIKNNQSSIYLFVKTRNKLTPISKVILK